MATYYIDPISGNDAVAKASNTANAPWRRITRALHDALGTDTLSVNAPSVASANRGFIAPNAAGLIIRPTVASDRIHTTGCVDLSQNAVRHFADYETNFFTGVPSGWASIGTAPATDAANQLFGAGCSSFTVAGDGIRRQLGLLYYATRPMRIRIIYKTVGAGILQIQQRDGIADAQSVDFINGAWVNTNSLFNDLPSTGGAWSEWVSPWIIGVDAASTAYFRFNLKTGGGSALLQNFEVEFKADWTLVSGSTYACRLNATSLADAKWNTAAFGSYHSVHTLNFWKCTLTAWNSNNIESLEIVKIESVAADATAPAAGFLHWNKTSNTLYYTLVAGESIDNLHFECGLGVAINTKAACRIDRPKAWCGTPELFWGSHTTGVVDIISPIGVNCAQGGYHPADAGSMVLYNPVFYNTQNPTTLAASLALTGANGEKLMGDGYFSGTVASTVASALTIHGGSCKFGGDDSYQTLGAGSMYIYGCTSDRPYSTDIELAGDRGTPTIHVKGFSGTGGWVGTYKDQSEATCTETVVMRDCAFHGVNGVNNPNFSPAAGGTTYDINTTVICTASGINGTAIPASASNIQLSQNISAAYTDRTNGDMTPVAGGILQGTGTKWWTTPRAISSTGEPYPDFDLDLGGVQSTHSPHHPTNM